MVTLAFVLPAYEAAINQFHDEVANFLHMEDELLRLFPPIQIVHAGTTRLVSSPNILDRAMQPHKTKFTMKADMFLQTDVSEFKNVVFGVTNDLIDQRRKQTAEVMLATGEAAGNYIDGDKGKFWDTYIEMLRRLPYSEHGHKLFMSPDTERKIQETAQTPEQRQRMQEVIRAKREEYFAHRRSRHLA